MQRGGGSLPVLEVTAGGTALSMQGGVTASAGGHSRRHCTVNAGGGHCQCWRSQQAALQGEEGHCQCWRSQQAALHCQCRGEEGHCQCWRSQQAALHCQCGGRRVTASAGGYYRWHCQHSGVSGSALHWGSLWSLQALGDTADSAARLVAFTPPPHRMCRSPIQLHRGMFAHPHLHTLARSFTCVPTGGCCADVRGGIPPVPLAYPTSSESPIRQGPHLGAPAKD
ncbi:unnamed protein product [Lepidochelys kempii]